MRAVLPRAAWSPRALGGGRYVRDYERLLSAAWDQAAGGHLAFGEVGGAARVPRFHTVLAQRPTL